MANRTIAIWGLSFKPNTDDMREASSRTLMEALWGAGARVQAFDPVAMPETRRIYGERADLTLTEDAMSATDGADALVIVTEWSQFRSPDLAAVRTRLRHPVLVDGRNVLDAKQVTAAGLSYVSIGRTPVHPG
jgi:UDPglucose 6-dehydrogenase